MIHTDATIEAIITEVRTRMPTLEQMSALPDDGTMGPDVTIPAVWMHLLLQHIRHLAAQRRTLELESAGALLRRDSPMTDDETGDYAGALADHAIHACAGPMEGASVLIQGAVAILVASLPPAGVIDALSNIVDIFDLRATLGMEATIQ